MDGTRRVAVTLEQCWHRVPGGTATSILRVVRALSRRGDLNLVGVSARHRDPPPPSFRPSIEVRPLPLPRLALYEAWHALRWPPVERATGPVDLVHATAVVVPPTSAPLVVTIHDLAFLADSAHATRHGHRFFRRGTELARRHARLVLVPSEATAAECRHAGFAPERIRLVPWGVDAHAVTDQEVEAVRRTHALDRPYVLFVGTVEPRKNLAGVIGAMATLAGRDVDLVLVGPAGWNEDLDRRIAALDGTGIRVRRLGFQPPEALPALYAACAAFCFPSRREGFGLPVLEAMGHGAPVVTSASTATAEVAGDAALLVDPRDHAAIGAALARVLDDAALATDLRTRGRARAATYTWERTADLTAAAYAEAAP
ncbi:MAG: glycosyltransferase family 4 protein [Acidimicrobiales bacterium]